MATAQESTTRRFFDDLLTMEVNVIVKDGMTARKMPSSVEAFNDVAEKYDDFLAKFDRELEEAFDGQTRQSVDAAHEGSGAIWADPGGKDGEWISTGTFTQLAAKAKRLERDNESRPDGSNEGLDVVLKRLERNSRILATMLTGSHRKTDENGHDNSPSDWMQLEALRKQTSNGERTKLTKEDLVNLRKAWEVGTEQVVMQTVAQVDGDIVTRVQQERATAADVPLHDIHRHMVGESLQHWRFLFATVASFTLSVFRSFFGDGD